MDKLEILKIGSIYQVWDYNGNVLFKGNFAECDDFVFAFENEDDSDTN